MRVSGSLLPIALTRMSRWVVAVAAVCLTALFGALASDVPPAYAADATWSANGVEYNGRTYEGPKTATANQPPGIGEGKKYYENLSDGQSSVIYFENDDVANADRARVVEYQISNGEYNQPSTYTPISIDRQSASQAANGNGGEDEKEITSCVVNGIGYILCPIINFLADATDNVFKYLETSLLRVETLATDDQGVMYKAWSIMRQIANVMFIAVFIAIIYSHLTNTGLSNYNLKRMLPRLILAIVAVNLSYYICALLIDVSNIVGSGLNGLLIETLRVVGEGAGRNSLDVPSWGEAAAYLLSGGTLAVAGLTSATAASVAAMGPGVLYLLVFALVPVATIMIVTFAVLAARQAIIVVMVVISPIAFVLYILPGTSKWFDRWQEIFSTMLVMYPMFALLFGGSHLASYLIAQTNNRWETLLIALFVQAVPLVITPFLIRFSGRLLGRFAGMINNPTRGVGDKAKIWANREANLAKGRRMAAGALGTSFAKWHDNRTLEKEDRLKSYDDARMRRYRRTTRGQRYAIDRLMSQEAMSAIENQAGALYEDRKRFDPTTRQMAMGNRLASDNYERAKQGTAAFMAQITTDAGTTGLSEQESALASQIRSTSHEKDLLAMSTTMAQKEYKSEFANLLDDSGKSGAALAEAQRRQAIAAGTTGEIGARKVKAGALSDIAKANREDVDAIQLTSDVRAGDVTAMGQRLHESITKGDMASMRAYTDMLAQSANPGIQQLRDVITDRSNDLNAMPDIELFKHHINSNSTINTKAEDIGVWARNYQNDKTLAQVTADSATYKTMAPSAWLNMAASSQHKSLDTGFMTPEFAQRVLEGNKVSQVLKGPPLERIKGIADPTYMKIDKS